MQQAKHYSNLEPLNVWIKNSSGITPAQCREVVYSCRSLMSTNSKMEFIYLIKRMFLRHPHLLSDCNGEKLTVELMDDYDLKNKCIEVVDYLNKRNTYSAFQVLPIELQVYIKLLFVRVIAEAIIQILPDKNIKKYLEALERRSLENDREIAINYASVLGFRKYRWENGDFHYTPAEKRDIFMMIKDVLKEYPEIDYTADQRKKIICYIGQLTHLKASSIREAVGQLISISHAAK